MLQDNIHTCITEKNNRMSYAQQLQHSCQFGICMRREQGSRSSWHHLGWEKRGRTWTRATTCKGIRLLFVRSEPRGRGGDAAGRVASWHALGYIDARRECTPSL
jgi:hypothetical protein